MTHSEIETIPARLTWHHETEPREIELALGDGAIDDVTFANVTELPPLVRAVTFEPTESPEPGVLAWLVVDADSEDTLGALEVVAGAGA